MGIRLSFRNKDKPDEEYCLGKYFSYAEPTDAHDSVDFLVRIGALDQYEWPDDEIPERSEMAAAFIRECEFCMYQDYGCMFELSTEDLVGFLGLYTIDRAKLRGWELSDFNDQLYGALAFIQRNATVESRWEFKLGA